MVGTVVIGGGAAGIAAARRLRDAGEDVLLLEAKDRLGGRAHSVSLDALYGGARLAPPDDVPADAAVDYGCSWLHSAGRNPWAAIADAEGFAVDRSPANWDRQWHDLGFARAEQDAAAKARDRWHAAALASLNGIDRPLGDFVASDAPWRPYLDAISGYANGAPLDVVSLHDWAAYENAATEENWTLPRGYGTLVSSYLDATPARLGAVVTRIDHRGRQLRVESSRGTIDADRVVIAVPTPALARIVFDPPLPAKQDAAAALPLGIADKVLIAVDAPEWPANAHLIGDPHRACTASYRLSPFGWPVIEGFFGGDCADALETGDAAAFAVGELVALLGSAWRSRLTPLAVTRWRHEAFIGGSYSHARIGAAGQRAVLGKPVDDRLFFAGEACHPTDFSTAHGAYQTGIAAADAILAGRRGTA